VLEQQNGMNKISELRINLTEVSDNWLVSEQQRDTEIQDIIVKLKNNEFPGNLDKTYELRKGILHRKIQRNSKTKCLPVIPKGFSMGRHKSRP